MRKTHWDMTEDLNKGFSSLELPKSDISTMISLELFISGCLMIDPLLQLDQAWSLVVGYDEPVLKNLKRVDIVTRLRILFPEFRSKKVLTRRMEAYGMINEKYRLFDISEERKAAKRIPRFFSNRHTVYEQILSNPIPRKLNDIPFAIPEKTFEYSRMGRGGISQHFHGSIPEALTINNKHGLPSYREKKRHTLALPFNGRALAKEMDEIAGGSSAWENRASSVVLESVDWDEEFVYRGNQHIGGALGAGKSTFMVMETYRLVKQEGARIGFIEGSVSQVIERVKVLRELGIDAVPIIGRSSRKQHQENYLFANSSEILEISDWAKNEYQALTHLSDVCVIKALSEDVERNKPFPCTGLKQDQQSVMCPLANQCGVYHDFSRLAEADVWVATSASVLKTRIPAMIDPLERTIYEAMYDLMEIVFIDEVDDVQMQFDETFLSEYNVFGGKEDIFESLYNESNQLTMGRYQYAGDPVVNEWKDKLRQLDQMVWRIYKKLESSHTLRKDISRYLIRAAALADSISGKISDNTEAQEKIRKGLMKYASEPFQDPALSGPADRLIETDHTEEKQKLLTKITEKLLKGSMKPRVNQKLFYDQLEFFIYLCRAEECIKYILTSFPVIQAKLGLSVNFSPLFTMQRDYQPFMKEAMTGTMLGYKYDLKDGESMGVFKLVEYTGVGRLLLHDWHRIYEDSDQKQGPAVILLSGTSHAPDSAHYHLNTGSKWLLKAERTPSNIQMVFKPVLDARQGGFLEVSGIRDDETRSRNLYEMVHHLKSDIQYELKYWTSVGNARRVLLVVNSYDDAATVGRAFRGDPGWEGRYKILSKVKSDESDQFPRSMIESFRRDQAEVLIVPLMSVGRGYNILDQRGEALFGSVFFLVRPYPIPNDMNYMVQILHAYLPQYLKQIERQGIYYDKAVSRLRRVSNSKFETMYRKPDFWGSLDDSEREVMAWFTFIPVWQMIGRLLRGGKNARVFYCDFKFGAKPAGNSEGMSMLDSWAFIMNKHQRDPLFESLYGPFIQGINQMIREAQWNEEDAAFCTGD
ncbi:hypothetical protein E6C60_0864 [Paenibacillus algicola]|uniref:pPIWI-RE three-gene island domain-containing protein n=1 Tax=Paenibacillus algicola TaxID=2565926 RepID=A0A4P8XGW7_9BACL|nr:hypothetical protein [Paenibacillus algicola]QCT01585.1 hypothetical protein E6C60_0864 [Paenibacillus algicola]